MCQCQCVFIVSLMKASKCDCAVVADLMKVY